VPPGSTDGEHIRVDPPGSSPVPGLEDGYWRWNQPGAGWYNPGTGTFGGTRAGGAAGGTFANVVKLNWYCVESVDPSQIALAREIRDRYVGRSEI
jgi:hypothetical protein